MKLNGWQRLWIVACVPMVLLGFAGATANVDEPAKALAALLIFGIACPAGLYAIGWAVAWVRRGFRG